MSFILDAIAKSERERQQQEVPDARILAMPASDSQHPRRNLPYFVVSILLLCIIVLLIWMQTDRSTFNRFLQSKTGTVEPVVTQINTTDTKDSSNEIVNDEINDSTAALNQVIVGTSTTPSSSVAKISTSNVVSLTRKPVVPDQLIANTTGIVPTLQVDTQAAVAVKIESLLSQKIANSTSTTTNGKSINLALIESTTQSELNAGEELVNQTDVENVAPAPLNITPLNELPYDVRRDLPSVSFTGHLYSKNVNLSYVMVDGGRSVIAGQQIVDELFLHKVTPTGAIVDFRGFLIETGILQNWSLK